MKKPIIIIAVLAALLSTGVQNVSAQESRFSIRAGAGFLSFDDYVAIFGLIGDSFKKCDRRDGNSYLLNPNVSVTYDINRWLSLGAGATIGNMNSKGYDANDTMIHSVDFTYTTMTIFADTYYFRRGIWAMYGSYGAGATLFRNTTKDLDSDTGVLEKSANNSLHFNFQFYPLALRFGKTYGGFVEVGWGCRGFVNAGMFYEF